MESKLPNPYINTAITNPSAIETAAEKKAILRLITEIAYALNGAPKADMPFPSTKGTLNYIKFIDFLRTELDTHPQIKNHPYIAPALNIGTIYTSPLGTGKLTEFSTNHSIPKMFDIDNYMKLVAKFDSYGNITGINDCIKNGTYYPDTSEKVYDAFMNLFNSINSITLTKTATTKS